MRGDAPQGWTAIARGETAEGVNRGPKRPVSPVPGWSGGQRLLHWSTVLLVALGFLIAWVMVALPFRLLLAKFILYQLHKTFGLLVFLFCAARLAFRASVGRPEFDTNLPDWQRRAATIMHAALYVLLIAIPVLGYFVAATSPVRIPTLFLGFINVPHVVGADQAWFALLRQVHRAAAILLVVLAGLHAAAAIHNHRAGLPTLRRMWRDVTTQQAGQRPR